jgi:histone H3/H4
MARIKSHGKFVRDVPHSAKQRAHKALKTTTHAAKPNKESFADTNDAKMNEMKRIPEVSDDSKVEVVSNPPPVATKPPPESTRYMAPGTNGLKRKHKWRSGTVAKRTHKKLCNDTSMMISKSAMRRIVLDGANTVSDNVHLSKETAQSVGYLAINMMDAIIRETVAISSMFKRKSINPPVSDRRSRPSTRARSNDLSKSWKKSSDSVTYSLDRQHLRLNLLKMQTVLILRLMIDCICDVSMSTISHVHA